MFWCCYDLVDPLGMKCPCLGKKYYCGSIVVAPFHLKFVVQISHTYGLMSSMVTICMWNMACMAF